MFNRHFMTSKLGVAALVSVAMMITFAVSAPTIASAAGARGAPQGETIIGLPTVVLA